jgi:hypothetical protein
MAGGFCVAPVFLKIEPAMSPNSPSPNSPAFWAPNSLTIDCHRSLRPHYFGERAAVEFHANDDGAGLLFGHSHGDTAESASGEAG